MFGFGNNHVDPRIDRLEVHAARLTDRISQLECDKRQDECDHSCVIVGHMINCTPPDYVECVDCGKTLKTGNTAQFMIDHHEQQAKKWKKQGRVSASTNNPTNEKEQ